MGRKNTDHTTEASFRELVIRTSEMMYDTSRKRQSQDRIADLEVSRNNISELKPRHLIFNQAQKLTLSSQAVNVFAKAFLNDR